MVFIILFVIPAIVWLVINEYKTYTEENKKQYDKIFYVILACTVISFLLAVCLPEDSDSSSFFGVLSIILFLSIFSHAIISANRDENLKNKKPQKNGFLEVLISFLLLGYLSGGSSHSEENNEIDRWHCEDCGGWVDDEGECDDCGHYNPHTY